jgi:hypothetical protein
MRDWGCHPIIDPVFTHSDGDKTVNLSGRDPQLTIAFQGRRDIQAQYDTCTAKPEDVQARNRPVVWSVDHRRFHAFDALPLCFPMSLRISPLARAEKPLT